MEKIGIVTDEGADLPQEIIEKNQIAVVPVKLDWPEIENLPGENTFQRMRELEKRGIKSFGKTSQPSPKNFLDKYKEKLSQFEKIICITLTSIHSGTYNSAIQGKNFLTEEEQKRVFVVDSLNASASEALTVLKAVDLVSRGKEAEEIVKELEDFVNRISFFVITEDPKWLEASGRISSLVANLMRRLAKAGIIPLLTFKKGKLKPTVFKANTSDIPTVLFRKFKNDIEKFKKEGKKIRAVITHGDDLESARRLKEMIEKEFKNSEVVFLNIIDNVIGAITGPNTLVLAWAEI